MTRIPLIYHRVYDLLLPDKHRFPGTKYSLLMRTLESEGLLKDFLKYSPKPATAAQLSIVHDQNYLQAIEFRTYLNTIKQGSDCHGAKY